MLDVSRALNPDCEHVQGDMRTVRLGRLFDAVFVHDAITYMTTRGGPARARWRPRSCTAGRAASRSSRRITCARRSGPRRTTAATTTARRGLRYLEWTWDPDPEDTTYTVDYAYLLRDEGGAARVEHDRHVEGLFSREEWLRLLAEVGFEAQVMPFAHSELEPGELEVFVAQRPRRGAATEPISPPEEGRGP